MDSRKKKTPIDVLLGQMRIYNERANLMARQLYTIIDAGVMLSNVEDKKFVLGYLAEIEVWRSRAFRCAVFAAPYVHPKLKPIQAKKECTPNVDISNRLTNPKEALERYRQSLNIMPPDDED